MSFTVRVGPLTDDPDVVEGDIRGDPTPVRGHRSVPRRGWCRHEEVLHRDHDVADRSRHLPRARSAPADAFTSSTGRTTRSTMLSTSSRLEDGRGTWAVGGAGWLLGRLAFEIGQGEEEIDGGGAVTQSVVALEDEAQLVVLEAVDEPHLPERPVPIEREGLHAAEQFLHLQVVSGTGHRRQPDVVVDVERAVVDPDGPALAERHEHDLLAQPGELVEPSRDHRPQLVETYPPSPVPQRAASRYRSAPTCWGSCAVSMCRNEASRTVNRS